MEAFFRTHAYLVEHTNATLRRTLMDEIDWDDRMIGIKGTGTFNQVGTSGQKISFQYSFVPVMFVTRKVQTPKNVVQAILPVRLPPPGGNGIIPMILATNIKKKQVSR